MKFKYMLILFVILEMFDFLLSFYGTSITGLGFEKNLFMRSMIETYGIITVLIIKISVAAFIPLCLNYLYNRFSSYRKHLLYLSVALCIIAAYGFLSSVYALLFLI
jgi:hypothetical protein